MGILPSRHFDVRMTSYKKFLVTPYTKFEQAQANILANMQVSSLFCSTTHSKVAMATTNIYENCHYVQNDPHKCKIKLEKLHFDIFIKESLPGGGGRNPPPPQVR